MPARSLERLLAAASLGLVLMVILASAAIRLSDQDLGIYLPVVRGIHRASASLATLLIVAAGWLAWRSGRRSLATAIVVVTAGLSILGAATGISPPLPAQAGNLLGGLLLAALLAWLLGPRERPQLLPWALVALQACLGAWIALFADELWTPVLLTHALLGVSLAAGAAWLVLRARGGPRALPPVLLAIAVPASGAASALLGLPLGATLAHSASVALRIGAAAYLHARLA
jgi:hypothetical protein